MTESQADKLIEVLRGLTRAVAALGATVAVGLLSIVVAIGATNLHLEALGTRLSTLTTAIQAK